jgi:hypothetical protein
MTKTKRAKRMEKKAKRAKQTRTVLDTPTLKKLCDNAERLKFHNGPNRKFWEEVDPKGEHVITFAMRHSPNLAMWGDWRSKPDFPWNFDHNGGVNVRAVVSCRMKDGRRVDLLCDFDQPEFEALP